MEIFYLTAEPVATIYKKSLIPPFKDIAITVPNLRRAIIATKRNSKGQSSYRVELESFDGAIVPVTTSFDSSYVSKQHLLFKINASISSRTPFEYTITQYGNIFFGAVLIVVSMAIAFIQYTK